MPYSRSDQQLRPRRGRRIPASLRRPRPRRRRHQRRIRGWRRPHRPARSVSAERAAPFLRRRALSASGGSGAWAPRRRCPRRPSPPDAIIVIVTLLPPVQGACMKCLYRFCGVWPAARLIPAGGRVGLPSLLRKLEPIRMRARPRAGRRRSWLPCHPWRRWSCGPARSGHDTARGGQRWDRGPGSARGEARCDMARARRLPCSSRRRSWARFQVSTVLRLGQSAATAVGLVPLV